MKAARHALIAAIIAAPAAHAVYLNPDGLGQGLIFPYYTVQSAGGNAFNTYVSIANRTSDSKVARLRFREGRNGKSVLELDVFLAPHDMWTAAVVPSATASSAPARLVTAAMSCTNPPLSSAGAEFDNDGYSGQLDDGAGTGLERTREGFFEAIEMATLTGASAAAIAPNANGTPANCGAVAGDSVALNTAAPSGGLSGTLTLINVANGMDFGLNADALAELSTRSMYRPRSDPTPVDFNSQEIDAVSHVVANGNYYRASWPRPVDAVSAVLMRAEWGGELVLDPVTLSQTDMVVTFPTRQNYVTTSSAVPPFSRPFQWFPLCAQRGAGEPIVLAAWNRESAPALAYPPSFDGVPPPGPPPTICPAASIMSLSPAGVPSASQSRVLGSTNLMLGGTTNSLLPSAFVNGSVSLSPSSGFIFQSQSTSTRTNLATGAVTMGPQAYAGLPVTGFWARTFQNGLLNCAGATCQGNYGSAFPLTYRRSVSP